jgi:DNA-binding transcriptional LysR family regulator
MSIRHLITLVAIADKGSFFEAADAVFITQAAVSMQMKALEEELGLTLFDRTKRPPLLNDIGLALVPKARVIVRSYEQFMQASATREDFAGNLRLGAVPTIFTGILPSALVSLRDSVPQLHIAVSSGLSSSLVQQVERGSIDAAIISEPPHERTGLNWTAFGKEELVLIAPLDSANLSPEKLLESNPFIRFNRSAWVGKMIEDYLNEQGIIVNETMELNTLEAISTMVHYGLGVSVVPRRKISYPGSLALKQLSFSKNAPYRNLGVIEREDNPKRNFTKILISELARETASNYMKF